MANLAHNVVFNGTFIAQLNDFQDEYELDGVRYAVSCEYCENLQEGIYWATKI